MDDTELVLTMLKNVVEDIEKGGVVEVVVEREIAQRYRQGSSFGQNYQTGKRTLRLVLYYPKSDEREPGE